MIQPIYILENGEKVPYVPIDIKDHREAYAATLHVLFKHVADFHICVVQAFSKKYGIPEDDIMQTIQESDAFKNMQVDPVLHHDPLGYLSPMQKSESTSQESVPVPATVSTQVPDTAPNQLPATVKKRIVKKKTTPTPEPTPEVNEPLITSENVIPVKVTEIEQLTTQPATSIEKKKVIRKKVTSSIPSAPPTDLERVDVIPQPQKSDAIVQLILSTETPTAEKKIIRRKK